MISIPVRSLFAAALVAIAAATTAVALPPLPGSAVEGLWWGEVTTPQERVELGFELRRSEADELKAYLTQPIAGYWELEMPGVARFDGLQVTLEELKLALTLDGDLLAGTYGRSQVAMVLRRVESLPKQQPVPVLPTGPGPRWQTRLGGEIFASPVVADGVAYVGSTNGVFNAVRTSDGEFVWAFSAGRPILGAARVAGDALYFVCDNGYLFRLERATGKEVWRYDLGDSRVPRVFPHPQVFDWDWQAPRPLVAEGVVFVGSGDGSFHAVDAASGGRLWRAETGGKIRNGAAIAGERVIVGSNDQFVYAFDRASGREVWKHDSGAEVDSEPLVADDRVVVGNRGIGLIALSVAAGERLWKTSFWGSWLESTPTLVDGVLYVGSSDLGRVSALDPTDGRVLWRTEVHGWTFGTPLVTADKIYAGAAGGKPYVFRHVAGFTVLDRKSGRLVERWPLAESPGGHQWGIAGSLALAGDTIVATTIDGSTYGFPLR